MMKEKVSSVFKNASSEAAKNASDEEQIWESLRGLIVFGLVVEVLTLFLLSVLDIQYELFGMQIAYTAAVIGVPIFVVGCINKPPASSQYLEKGYFEDLSFLRESPEKNNVDSNNINEISIIEESKFNKELENIYITYENTPKNKYLNGYTIQIFSGLEREKADSIFFTADSIYSELDIYTLYDQPNYRVKVGKYFYRINANKALNKLINDFSEAIIVPERIKIN